MLILLRLLVGVSAVKLAVIVAVFPIVFLGEIPDKSMFASVVMATEGRPRQVWLGAAAAKEELVEQEAASRKAGRP